MDRPWSQVHPAPTSDPLDIALREVEGAIAMVHGGQARRVRLVGLAASERAAGPALAMAQAAGVQFALERGAAPAHAVSLLVGPAVDD